MHWSTARVAAQAPAQGSEPRSLSATYGGDFLIGTAIDFTETAPLTPQELAIIKTHFNVITPENSMKPASIHPAEDQWNWAMADTLVKFCGDNNIQVVGHCLVWHAQTGRWFFGGENGRPVTREKALERMKQHIMTEVGHFKGKLKGWDVVNEAISDRGPGDTENLRSAPWLTAIGPDYINYAFKFAHEADPDAELYYNDYGIEKGNKRKSSVLLLKRLISEGVPIKAVGIQGHWGLNNLPYEELDAAISEYEALGLHVNITEMDITMRGQGGGQLTPDGAPTTATAASGPATGPGRGRGLGRGPITPPTPEQLVAQAQAYAKFFQIFEKHKDAIDRVTFWGLNDARSWRRGQAPLLLDGQNKPKPALTAILEAKVN
ncbi:MAG TPA: endo-1,4-beta-xylanase [Tepidisphaeraceae bacterium]